MSGAGRCFAPAPVPVLLRERFDEVLVGRVLIGAHHLVIIAQQELGVLAEAAHQPTVGLVFLQGREGSFELLDDIIWGSGRGQDHAVHEAGLDPLLLQAFSELDAEGRLPIRVYGLLDGNNDSLMTSWFSQGPIVDPAAFFTVRSIKVFYDGSLGSRTALLRRP